jgi:N-acetylmuramoyl-L-alanine amidase
MRKINLLVIHCADTYATMDIGVKEIDTWHRQKKWNGCGYHYVIRRNGVVETGRQEAVVGAHVEGYNANSIGVCYAGGKGTNGRPEDNRTPEQKESLRKLIAELLKKYPGAKVVGHHDLDPGKACPSFNVKTEYL